MVWNAVLQDASSLKDYSVMCVLLCPQVWTLCDGSGWKSTRTVTLDKYAFAALRVPHLSPHYQECARYISEMDHNRFVEKGRWMTEDHLKQEAVKWARAHKNV